MCCESAPKGGDGFGDPRERPVVAVVEDVADGLVSRGGRAPATGWCSTRTALLAELESEVSAGYPKRPEPVTASP